MRIPTLEQQTVLNSNARVRIVRAAPGSGKTTLVGMLIREELRSGAVFTGGIAAVSFTRVGGQEIRKEIGYDLSHPHFVGTIDAFLFRYVVRPFLKRVNSNWASPRLIPADWSPKSWGKAPGGGQWIHRGSSSGSAKTYNLFEICFIDSDERGPILACPQHYSHSGVEQVPVTDRAALFNVKKDTWKRLGWLTHSDAAFLASELLSDPTHGNVIRSIVLRRFPLLIVDELQDTGYYLSKSIRLLLGDEQGRGVLVGDPNQAIYEFNGARPDLFNGFETIAGATTLPLGHSQRCPIHVVSAAGHLKESDDAFTPASAMESLVLLARYGNMTADVPRLVESIRVKNPSAELKVITRRSKTVEELSANHAKEAKSLHSPALHHALRAVKSFRQGHNVRGIASIRAAIEVVVFGHEGATDEAIAEHGIDPRDWKGMAVRCLLKCNSLSTTTNLYDWQTAAGKIIDTEVKCFGLPASLLLPAGIPKPQKRNDWEKPSCDFLPIGKVSTSMIGNVSIQTVHAVKGETHDVTVFVIPDESQASRCPSTVWWSNDSKYLEERRIAYVAMTRTRGDLVVCTSERCYERLCTNQPAFVGSFKCYTIDECIAAFSQ